MSEEKNLALVAIFADTIRGERALRKMVEQIGNYAVVHQISNVYKRELAEEVRSEICAVLQIETNQSKEGLLKNVSLLKTIEPGYFSQGVLLTFNKEVNLMPGATLPDPRFLQDKLLLRCAAEVWGEYEHPIVGKTLNELVRSNQSTKEIVEFFAQGRVFL